MNRETITITIFQTLMAYNPNVEDAIRDTETVVSRLFPDGKTQPDVFDNIPF